MSNHTSLLRRLVGSLGDARVREDALDGVHNVVMRGGEEQILNWNAIPFLIKLLEE